MNAHDTQEILEGSSRREGSTGDADTTHPPGDPRAVQRSNSGLSNEAGAEQSAPEQTNYEVRDARPKQTLRAREGDPEWMVAYLNLGKHGKGPASHGEKIFTDASQAVAFFQKQRAGCASLWRKLGGSYVEQEVYEKVFPSEKGGAAKTV